jgi:hypothetical protein
MALLRPLEQQFEAETVARIHLLIAAIQALDVPYGPCRYYLSEIARSLDAGLFLAAVELSASLLELVARMLLIRIQEYDANPQTRNDPYPGLLRRQISIEYDRHMMFPQILNELESHDVIAAEDAAELRKFYNETRIPLHHGLSGRYVIGAVERPTDDPIALLTVASIHSFDRTYAVAPSSQGHALSGGGGACP